MHAEELTYLILINVLLLIFSFLQLLIGPLVQYLVFVIVSLVTRVTSVRMMTMCAVMSHHVLTVLHVRMQVLMTTLVLVSLAILVSTVQRRWMPVSWTHLV